MGGRQAETVARVVLLWALGAVTVGVFTVGTGEPVAACECAVLPDSVKVGNADAVFTGTLTDGTRGSDDSNGFGESRRYVFKVDEVFKGDVSAQQSVVTDVTSSCLLVISGPSPFVVFARTGLGGAVEDELFSDSCSGTRPLANGALPAGLGVGSLPRPGASAIGGSGAPEGVAAAADDGGTATAFWIALVVGGVVVVLTLGGFAVQRRSRRDM